MKQDRKTKKSMKTLYSGGLIFDETGNLKENHGILVEEEKISKIKPISYFEGFNENKIDSADPR